MKVYRDLSEFTPLKRAVVTVGTFDGVHIGHQTILQRVAQLAKEEDAGSVLLTFFPHPRLVLFPDDNDLLQLSTLEEKIDLIELSGIDHLIIHPFTVPFSRTTALEYVRDMLVKGIGVHKLVIGYDHHFGRNREGSLEQLKLMAPTYHFDVEEIPAQEINDVNVSSTKIRTALLSGDVTLANRYLGYAYSITGLVVQGNAMGRSIGYPTANVQPINPNKLIPGNGVYAVSASVGLQNFRGMANIGHRPTVVRAQRERTIEVHLFDFNGDLYGQSMSITFAQRIRDEIKFSNVEALRQQLQKDAEQARMDHPVLDLRAGSSS